MKTKRQTKMLELIKKYEQLEASIEKFAAKEYQRIFGR